MSDVVNPAVDSGGTGLKRQVMSALRWSAVAKFGGQLVNWAMTLVVIRLLAPADYGLVAMMTVLFMFLAMLGEMGFGSSIAQAPTLDEAEIRQTVGASLLVNLGICGFLLVAAPAIAAFYREPRLVDMTRVASLAFIGSGMGPVYNGLLQREMRWKTSARIDLVSGFAGNLTTLVFAWLHFGAWALILSSLVSNPVRVAMLFSTAKKLYWPSFRFRDTRRLWTFGGNILITRVVWYWSSQADVLIAGRFLGKEALGLYSVAVHLASLPMQRAAGMINGVAFVAFAKIQHDPRAVAFNTRLGVRLMAFVTFPVLWGIGAVAPELVQIAIGPTWTGAIVPLTLVALTIPIRMIGSIISTTIMSMGRVDIAMVTTIIGAFVAPPIFFLGSRYGIEGLSLAWVAVAPIMFALNMFRALPILGLSLAAVASEMWRPLVIAAVMFASVAAMREMLQALPVALLAAALVLTGALVYAVGTWLINRDAALEASALLFPGRFARWRRRIDPTPAVAS